MSTAPTPPVRPPQQPYPPPAPSAAPAKTSGLANAARVLALITCLGWLATILGIIALVGIAKPARRQSGKGLAIAGIILGSLQALLVVPALLIALLMPNLSGARGQARLLAEHGNLMQIGRGMEMYAMDNKDQWPVHVGQTVPEVGLAAFVSPGGSEAPPIFDPGTIGSAPLAVPYRFGAFTFTVSGGRPNRVREPSRFLLAYGQPHADARSRRAVLFADGSVETCDDAAFAKLRADQARLRADAGFPPLGPEPAAGR
jgi:hypothetical protein